MGGYTLRYLERLGDTLRRWVRGGCVAGCIEDAGDDTGEGGRWEREFCGGES